MLHSVVLSYIISTHITILYGVSKISKDLFRKKIYVIQSCQKYAPICIYVIANILHVPNMNKRYAVLLC